MTQRSHITISKSAGDCFRELKEVLQSGTIGAISSSQLVELLVGHWREHPPTAEWVHLFEFDTKLGRPRKPGVPRDYWDHPENWKDPGEELDKLLAKDRAKDRGEDVK